MKVKMFDASIIDSEERINKFLDNDKIDVLFVKQSGSGIYLSVTIWYEEL